MPEPWGTTLAYTRAELRRLRHGRGPARIAPIRICRQPATPEGAVPARSASGRYLYTLAAPLPPQPRRRRPAPLAAGREVG